MPVVALFGFMWIGLRGFETVGCEGICHDDLIFGAYEVYPYLLVGSVVAAVVVGGVLALLEYSTRWVALAGFAAVVAVVVGSSLVLDAGFRPMYERNERAEQGLLPTPTPPPDPTGAWSVGGSGDRPNLQLEAGSILFGHDGCNPFTGTWSYGDEPEPMILLSVSPDGDAVCDGVDTWLSHAASAMLEGGKLVINGPEGTPIGVLEPSR